MSSSTTETLVRGYINPDERGCIPGSTIHIPDWSEHMKARIAQARTKHERKRLLKILESTPGSVERFWQLWRNGDEPDSEAVEAVRRVGAWKQAQSYQPRWSNETLRLVQDEIYRGTRPTHLLHTINTKF
jgi:hypothetical protein